MSESISPRALEDIRQAVYRICRGIRPRKARLYAEIEYEEHVEDHVYRLLLQGVPEDKAVTLALDALGDPENLCHMLCSVHNRVPANLDTKLLWLGARFLAAFFVHGIMTGFKLLENYPILWLIPVLIVTGSAPFRYLRSLVIRVKQTSRIRRVCRQKGFTLRRMASPILSVFFTARRPEWVIEADSRTYCVHFLAIHDRHAVMRLLDSFAYTLTTTHGQGARFIDRAPRRFNSLRTGDQTYETQSQHNIYFPVSADSFAGEVERVLLLNPVPSEIQYLKGTTFEHAGNGDRVFGFTLFDAKSFVELLKKI